MQTIGVRELKTHLSEILRQVQEEGTVVEVSNRGQVIARLVPVRAPDQDASVKSSIWTDIDRLAAEIGAYLPDQVDAVELVNEVRRDL